MTSLVVPLKQYNTQSRISLEILKRCSSNLALVLYIIKEAKWHLSCHCHDNSYAAGLVLIKTKIPRFYPKGESTHNNLVEIVKAIWEPFVCRARPSVPLQKIANGDIWFFTERDWRQECCHGNNLVDVVLFLLWCTFLVPSLGKMAKNNKTRFFYVYYQNFSKLSAILRHRDKNVICNIDVNRASVL